MLGDIQNNGPKHAFENRRNPPRKQDNVGGQQNCSPGESLQASRLDEEEDQHSEAKHDVKQLVILN